MSGAARVAWPFIQKAAARGLGATEVIEALRAGGITTFRRQDMLALIREATGAELLKSDIARWPVDSVLPISRVRESVTAIVAPFSYTLRLIVTDARTGEQTEILRQAHSDQLMSAEAVAEEFMDSAAEADQYVGSVIEAATVIDVQRSGEFGVI
jgi:hypothetical protein